MLVIPEKTKIKNNKNINKAIEPCLADLITIFILVSMSLTKKLKYKLA